MRAAEWGKQVREDPKGAMEADPVIVVAGGLIAVAGIRPKWQPIQDNSSAPVLGTTIVVGGVAIVVRGVLFAVAHVIVGLGGSDVGDRIDPAESFSIPDQ